MEDYVGRLRGKTETRLEELRDKITVDQMVFDQAMMIVAAGRGTVEQMPQVHKDVWALVVQEEIEKPLLAIISEQKAQRIAKTNEITSLEAQVRRAQHDCHVKDQEIEGKKQEIRAQGQRISQLESRYKTDDKAFSELRAKYDARKSSEEAKDKRISDLEDQHKADRKAFSDLRAKYEERKSSEEAKDKRISDLEGQHNADVEALSKLNGRYEARKNSDKTRIRDRDNKYSRLEDEYQSLQRSCEGKDHEIQTLKGRVGRRDESVKVLQGRVGRRDARIQVLEDEADEAADMENEIQDLREQVERKDERILELEGQSSDRYDILQRKVREVDELIILRGQLGEVCRDNNLIMADQTAQIATLEDRMEDVVDEMENLQNLVSTLQANAQFQVASYRNIQGIVTARNRTIAERTLCIGELKAEITNLKDQARTNEGLHTQMLQNANNSLQSREQRLAEFVAAELGSDPASWMPFTQILSTCQHVPGIPMGDDRPWAILPAWVSDESVDESNPGSIFNICRQLFAGLLDSHFGARQVHLFRLLAQGLEEDSAPVDLVMHVIREFLRASEEKDVSMRQTFDYFYLVPLWQVADIVAFRWPGHSDAASLCDRARSLVTRSYFAPFYELIKHGCDMFASELQQQDPNQQGDGIFCPSIGLGFLVLGGIDDAFLICCPRDRSLWFVLLERGCFEIGSNFQIRAPRGGNDIVLMKPSPSEVAWIVFKAGG